MSVPPALEGLVQDASSLHRLVDSIQHFCEEQVASQAYQSANLDFLNYVISVAEGTKTAISQVVADGRSYPGRIENYRSNLQGLKSFWQDLHLYAKPATDAHRLRIPAALLNLATEQLQQIKGMSDARLVTLLTPHLMYFQLPHTEFKKLTATLASTIAGAQLPNRLGFVELPYSLAPNFLSNLIIYHELGHFVYEEMETAVPPHPQVSKLKTSMVDCLIKHVKDFGTWSQEDQLQAFERIKYWTYEIFCDLFAIRLIGPAFSFAALEFFNLLGVMSKSECVEFSESHPATSCRFYEHQRQLKADGWWSHVATLKSEHTSNLKQLAAIKSSDYQADFDGREQASVIKAFTALRPMIRRLVFDVTKGVVASPTDFGRYRQKIEESLLNGVVPSTVVIRGKRHIPPSSSIVNAAVCFYLTSIPNLMRNLQDQDAWDVSQRSHWIQRLESWTMKAIEDVQLLHNQARN